MHKRCYYAKHPQFARYGGRGIKVCDRWFDYGNFFADLGDPPAGMSLERERLDEDYGPTNCRWATRFEQAANTSRNRYVVIEGETLCVSQACRKRGLNIQTVTKRLNSGWDVERAFAWPNLSN